MSVFTKAALSASLCAVFFSSLASAAPSVKSPIVTKGEVEIEVGFAGSNDSDAAKDGAYGLSLEFGYGVTDRWFTEFETE